MQDDSQSVVRGAEQWAVQDAEASEWELCTPDAVRSAAQSCAVREELETAEPVTLPGSKEQGAGALCFAAMPTERSIVPLEQPAFAEWRTGQRLRAELLLLSAEPRA